MFVTYPQSGNGQRRVMSDHRRNMFLSFHLVVVSRDPRARGLSLSSQAIGSRNNMLLRSDGCFPSPALPPRRKGAGHAVRTALGRAGCSTLLMRSYLLCLTRVRVYLLPCLLKALHKRFRGERTFYKSSRASHHGGDVGWQSNFRSEVSAFRIDSGGQGVDSGVGHFGLFAVCTGSARGVFSFRVLGV